jgi:hypothetical protein
LLRNPALYVLWLEQKDLVDVTGSAGIHIV